MSQQPIDVSGWLPEDDPDEFPSEEEEEAVTTPVSQKKPKKVFFFQKIIPFIKHMSVFQHNIETTWFF